MDGKTTHFSSAEIEQAAKLNNVDPKALKEGIESGPDEEGRFSPFSKLPQLPSGNLQENDEQKLSSTGQPLFRPKADKSLINPLRATTKTDEDSTAYNWTGNKTANGNWPELGIGAVHRVKDISGGTSNAPVIAFGTQLNITNVDIWLPDGVGYKDEFIVDDTGSGPTRTDYWVDIYYHHDTASAIAYGVIKIDYNY